MPPKTLTALGAALVVLIAVIATQTMGGGVWPIENGASRATPLHFGLFVTPDPESNPIDPPERFTGYHVATDFEITEDELDKEIAVYAVCTGTGTYSGFAGGYGGLIVQECMLNKQKVSMIYGHLAIAPLPPNGTLLTKGQKIGVLGAARSTDTDGNRKHLHFGIHKGWGSNYHGYALTKSEIAEFIDPMTVLPL
ncbi:M23 family metallopeptidase [Candidatus Peribacteria bacterium]|nr:MAG: M23 family metallopeptidase [Candidatus Peribacteria bacterium]